MFIEGSKKENIKLISTLDPNETKDFLKKLSTSQLMDLLNTGEKITIENTITESRQENEEIISLLIMIGMFIGKDLGEKL